MERELEDPYEILGLEPGASSTEIHRRYRRLVYEYHPDRNREDPRAAERLVAINAAYQKLKENGWRFERKQDEVPRSPETPSGREPSEDRPSKWADGSPIHYPTREEVEALRRGAEVPKINPGKKGALFILGIITMYYFLEVIRGASGGDGGGGYGPHYYYEQNKRHWGP